MTKALKKILKQTKIKIIIIIKKYIYVVKFIQNIYKYNIIK